MAVKNSKAKGFPNGNYGDTEEESKKRLFGSVQARGKVRSVQEFEFAGGGPGGPQAGQSAKSNGPRPKMADRHWGPRPVDPTES